MTPALVPQPRDGGFFSEATQRCTLLTPLPGKLSPRGNPVTPVTTATTSAPATSATKAQLQEQNASLLEQIARLEAQLAERRDQLEQTVWLQSKGPDERSQGYTREGTRWVSFGVQYASIDKSGQRLYGAYKNCTAYGDLAEAVLEVFNTPTRLVRIGAYERPQPPSQDGVRRSSWVLTQFQAMPRLDAPEAPQAPAPAPAPEPAGDPLAQSEIPF